MPMDTRGGGGGGLRGWKAGEPEKANIQRKEERREGGGVFKQSWGVR